MIITRTPFRISLFGGGTDYPDWIREHGGSVIGLAIDKYCYISVRLLPPFFQFKHRIVYSRIELAHQVGEIQHPAVRAVLAETKIAEGLAISHDADLPARAGLGSSSAFTVGLLHGIAAMQGRIIGKAALASEAIRIEQEVIKENVGCQDQVWAAHGGLNRIDFARDGGISVKPIIVAPQRRRELVDSLLLVFSGLSRIASEVAQQQIANIGRNERHLLAMQRLVDDAAALVADEREPVSRLGGLLHQSWMLKRELASGLTNDRVDQIYDLAMANGASGGKLLGAGGGGFLAFVVPPERRAKVRDALRDLVQVSVDIDRDGSRVMVYEPAGLGSL